MVATSFNRTGSFVDQTVFEFFLTKTNHHELPIEVEKFLSDNGLHGWKCVLPPFIKREVLGLCSYRDKKISILNALVRYGSPEEIANTVIHEIAHALTPGARHGEMWVKCAQDLGLKDPKAVNEHVAHLPQHVQRTLYSHRLCVLSEDGSVELLSEFTNYPHNLRNQQLNGRPETRGRLRWKPL